MLRKKLISELANEVLDLKTRHPIRNELTEELQNGGKNMIRTSIDHFHNSRSIRYRQGKESALGYYQDAHDYESFKHKLLIPLGPKGNCHYQAASLDLATDQYIEPNI